ncbi:hypothetical protein PAMA_014707 [Pampus argenteus]
MDLKIRHMLKTRRDQTIKPHDVLRSNSGEYKVEKFLGEGTFGKVAQCVKLDSKEKVAVKLIPKRLALSAYREVKMLRYFEDLDLKKDNLVKFFEDFEFREHICLTFEMLDMSLWDFMETRSFKPLCLSETRVIAQQLLVTLNTLRSIGVVHADIKPDNVMLVNHQLHPFKLKLIDFGLAKKSFLLMQGNIVQALPYRAPEVILGLPLNEAIDMWGVGCIIAFMYFGEDLYQANEYKIIRDIVKTQGLPENHLLESGMYTSSFFTKVQDISGPLWRLKTSTEYTTATGIIINPDMKLAPSFHKCILKNSTEYEDKKAFMSLLQQMLHVDVEKRIIPSEALGHRFITMSHFPSDITDRYVRSAQKLMKPCLLEKSSITYLPLVTSSKRTILPVPTPDKTTAVNYVRSPGTNKASPPPLIPASDEKTSGLIEVKTRKRFLNRISSFFSRMMKSIGCCRGDEVKPFKWKTPTLMKSSPNPNPNPNPNPIPNPNHIPNHILT